MPIQSAAKDILGDRQSLMAHARRWDQNSPLVHGILERLATYTIGTGIFPVPGSASARWNKQVARMWADWSRRPEITDRFSWGTVQRILWRSVLRDGDSFLLLTTREDGAPAVQMIEAHRIRDPLYTMKASLDPGDGVIRDQDGRHLAYKLVRESDGILERQLDGDAVVQFLLPERPDQPRGVTILASALKTIHNLDDILRLEQVAVKDASSKVDIIKTATGEIDQGQVTESDEDISEPATHQDSMGYYNNIFGPETKVLQHGDEFTPYKSDRPSPAWQGFVTYLTDHIALSTGIPPSVLIPAKVGGADTRRELAAAARTLEAWQWMQADSYQRVYEFVIGTWLDRGEIGNAPKDWRRCRWQMPRSITADAGRESQADLNLVTAGLLTLEDYFGSQGWTGREKIEQIAAEQEFVRDLDPTGQLSTRLYSKVGAVQTIGEAFTYPATPEAPEESDGSDKPEEPKDENETDDQDDQPDNVDAGQ
jgi:capsid protein